MNNPERTPAAFGFPLEKCAIQGTFFSAESERSRRTSLTLCFYYLIPFVPFSGLCYLLSMFTGLIEQTSKVENIVVTSNGAKITFSADFDDVKIGDSIALNGACLSITNIENNSFSADIMKETLNLTNLKNLHKGDIINLERAMSVNSRFQGHIVSGHIDCCASVKNIFQDGFAKRMELICNTDLIVQKGSIAINGVSLTVTEVKNNSFEVSLIPETIKNTNLAILKIGDIVNIEYDILGKYIQKFTHPKKEITLEFLKENGF